MATLDELSAAREAIERDADALRARLQPLTSEWAARLERMRAVCAQRDEDFRAAASQIAVERYGRADAHLFSPEPPAVTDIALGSTKSAEEEALAHERDELVQRLGALKPATHELLTAAKAAGAMDDVRAAGRELGRVHAAQKELLGLDEDVRARLKLTNRRLESYRAACAVRPLSEPALARLDELMPPPERRGYEQLLDFYRLSDPSVHSFGRSFAGTQHFTDVKRNVAILRADGCPRARAAAGAQRGSLRSETGTVWSAYAVSGANAPGLRLEAAESELFEPISCADPHGDVYWRGHDAEFKLVSALCARVLGVRAGGGAQGRAGGSAEGVCDGYDGTVTLWSKKPLCDSCAAVIGEQLPRVLPRARIVVVVDDEQAEAGADGCGAPGASEARALPAAGTVPASPSCGCARGACEAHVRNGGAADGARPCDAAESARDAVLHDAAAPASAVAAVDGRPAEKRARSC